MSNLRLESSFCIRKSFGLSSSKFCTSDTARLFGTVGRVTKFVSRASVKIFWWSWTVRENDDTNVRKSNSTSIIVFSRCETVFQNTGNHHWWPRSVCTVTRKTCQFSVPKHTQVSNLTIKRTHTWNKTNSEKVDLFQVSSDIKNIISGRLILGMTAISWFVEKKLHAHTHKKKHSLVNVHSRQQNKTTNHTTQHVRWHVTKHHNK